MSKTKSSNPKQLCINCHFFAYARKSHSPNSNQYSEEVVDVYYRNWIKEKCYNYNQSTEIPEECDYSRGYNDKEVPYWCIVGLKCYKNVWPVIELSMERIPRTPDIETCSFLHTVPKYREKAFEEIVAVERKDCFFYKHKPGMSLEPAEELESRADQNKGHTKPLELETAEQSEQQEEKICKKNGKLKRGEKQKYMSEDKLISTLKETYEYCKKLEKEKGEKWPGTRIAKKVQNIIKSRYDVDYKPRYLENLVSKLENGRI